MVPNTEEVREETVTTAETPATSPSDPTPEKDVPQQADLVQEEERILAAAQKRQEAARQSVGSLSRGAVGEDPEADAFLRAFRSAL